MDSEPQAPTDNASVPPPLAEAAEVTANGDPATPEPVSPERLRALQETVTRLKQQLQQLVEATGPEGSAACCQALRKLVDEILVSSVAADMQSLARETTMLSAYLRELGDKPQHVTESCIRTLFLAVDVVESLVGEPEVAQASLGEAVAAVVDMDHISCTATCNALRKSGLVACRFASPEEALTYLGANAVDLVVLDTGLAAQDGFDLYNQLRELPHQQQTPVIFVTNPGNQQNPGMTSTSETHFLAKPYSMINYLELALKALGRVLKRRTSTPTPEPKRYYTGPVSPAVSPRPANATPGSVTAAPASNPAKVETPAAPPVASNPTAPAASQPAPTSAQVGNPPADSEKTPAAPPVIGSEPAPSPSPRPTPNHPPAVITIPAPAASSTPASPPPLRAPGLLVGNRKSPETTTATRAETAKGSSKPAAPTAPAPAAPKTVPAASTPTPPASTPAPAPAPAAPAPVASKEAPSAPMPAPAPAPAPEAASAAKDCDGLKSKQAAADDAANEARRRQEELEQRLRESSTGHEAEVAELERRIREAVTQNARASADLDRERGERRRTEQRAAGLAAQLQGLHDQLRQHLETDNVSQSRINELERQLRERDEALARASTELEKERTDRQLAEGQLRTTGELSAHLRNCLASFEEAKKGFKRTQEGLEARLQASLTAMNESEARLQKELAERQRLEEALAAAQRNLQEQTQKHAVELSKAQSAVEVEQAERRRLEGDLLQSRYASLDSTRVGLTLVNRLRREIRPTVDNLLNSMHRLLEIELETEAKKLAESLLEQALLLQTSLQESNTLPSSASTSGTPGDSSPAKAA